MGATCRVKAAFSRVKQALRRHVVSLTFEKRVSHARSQEGGTLSVLKTRHVGLIDYECNRGLESCEDSETRAKAIITRGEYYERRGKSEMMVVNIQVRF